MAKMDDLFRLMVSQKASDLHLTSGAQPCLRLHGEMVKLNYRILNHDECQALIFEILTDKQIETFKKTNELDCSYALPGTGRFRVNVFMQRRGIGSVFRVIPEKILTVDDLNLPQTLLDLTDCSKGLILVTGPTGSGKSTTLAALIDDINKKDKAHILTVEDPIEFVHENQGSLINQREVGNHTNSFANALRAALREDPDVILVGEMRDLETIGLAMTAAETGHIVFGTLHTNSAPKTVDRIIDAFPSDQQAQVRVMLSESLRGVIAQGLLPRADKPGRVAVLEVLKNTKAIANLIREGKTFQIPSVMQTSSNEGMMTFESSIKKLVAEGKVSEADASSFLGYKIKATSGGGGVNQTNPATPGNLSKPGGPKPQMGTGLFKTKKTG